MKRRYHIHMPGVVYAVSVLLVGLAAMNSQNNLLFWVFGTMFAGLVISGIVSGAMMLGVHIRRFDPHHSAVGEPMIVRYALTNRNRIIPIFNVYIEERPLRVDSGHTDQQGSGWQHFSPPARAWIMHAGPGETVHGEAVFWPTSRGEMHLREVRVWTTFPFGIIKKSVSRDLPQHTLIYPRAYRLRSDLFHLIEAPAPIGTKLSQQSGPGDDYYGMREYREGDSVRNIAWKRSALLDDLVCIDRSMPSPPRLRVVLDLTRPTNALRVSENDRWSARELEERAVSLAASILRAAEREGFEIGLTVLGTNLPRFAVRQSHWHLGKLMAALAGIDLDMPRQQQELPPVGQAEHCGLIVVHPDRSEMIASRDDVVYLTGRQLDDLSLGPMGWDPVQQQVHGRDHAPGNAGHRSADIVRDGSSRGTAA